MPAPLSEQEVAKVLELALTPRAKRIGTYQRYYDGTVYDGRPDFLSSDVPVTERKPCIQYPGVRNAVRAFSSMTLGDKRFPAMTTLSDEDDSVFDERLGLDQDQSATIDTFLKKVIEQTRLPAKAKQILELAMASGTAVPMAAIVKGRLAIKQLDPKVCWPEFESDGVTLVAVEERYLYVEEQWDSVDKKFVKHVFQYRRRIDATSDVVFEPYEIRQLDEVPRTILDPGSVQRKEKTRFEHNFEFCPVLWYRFLDTVSDVSHIDGRPVHWGLLSLCDAVNFGLSQRYRAALYSGDPQPWETGVDDDENAVDAPMGRRSGASSPNADLTTGGWQTSPGSLGGDVRRRGVTSIWSSANPEAKFGLLTLPGDGLRASSEDVSDNRRTLRESLGHIELDTAALSKSELSARAIEEMKAPQVSVCNEIREDFGANCLLPLVNMLLRVALASNKGLYIAGRDKALPILERFYVEIGSGDSAPANDTAEPAVTASGTKSKTKKRHWFDLTIKLAWGAYSETSDTEEQTRVNTATMAHEKNVVTLRSAVQKVAPVFGIHNVDQYMATLTAENEKKQQAALVSEAPGFGGADAGSTPNDEGAATESATAKSSTPAAGMPPSSTPGAGSPAASSAGTAGANPPARAAAKGTRATQAAAVHERASSGAGVAQALYDQLAEDFPESAIAWVRAADVHGPIEVPIDSIDFSNAETWAASSDGEVPDFVEKIQAGVRKPIVLVNEPNNEKLIVVDGHHRALAYQELGESPPAYVVNVGAVHGPWDTMHDEQNPGGREPPTKKKAA